MEEKEFDTSVKPKQIGNIVAEAPGTYNAQKELKSVQCFQTEKPTIPEMVSLGDYQDVHPWNTQKQDWSFKISENWKKKPWCYVINSCCRSQDFYNSMVKEEQDLIDFRIKNLDTLIEKGKIIGNPIVYRGVSEVDWLPENHGEKTEYTEDAFGSFSLEFEKAYQYVNPKNPIIFQLTLKPEMRAF
ncbi:hypothetical protein MmiEs2_15830 [Methanimicrococcus stummii]|uniref:Uncharacterized protein n=1 Tax=Methanimicrococcus stummii TaxID=3028294 RepID=A0AA96VJ62_9EURY|nr:hypothetical protein [Methanimicrococcus sp. Es2]WNY29356.1 hypothetical protein MmiEs2_15830 [Methanimicrococcus sp. Es2]